MFGQLLPNKNKNTTVHYSDLATLNWGTKGLFGLSVKD
jgi:hypothetical protein